jgi:hypothetical protein
MIFISEQQNWQRGGGGGGAGVMEAVGGWVIVHIYVCVWGQMQCSGHMLCSMQSPPFCQTHTDAGPSLSVMCLVLNPISRLIPPPAPHTPHLLFLIDHHHSSLWPPPPPHTHREPGGSAGAALC